jgi:ABC-type multidrug transport system ATPase subunit
MQIIQEMTKRCNITVLCSLHQPRTEIFKLFDQLLLMSIGRNMYFGPASEASAYFTTLGFPCPLGFNLADWVLDITTLSTWKKSSMSPDLGADVNAGERRHQSPLAHLFATHLSVLMFAFVSFFCLF